MRVLLSGDNQEKRKSGAEGFADGGNSLKHRVGRGRDDAADGVEGGEQAGQGRLVGVERDQEFLQLQSFLTWNSQTLPSYFYRCWQKELL